MGRPALTDTNYRLRSRGGVYYVFWTDKGKTKRISTGERQRSAAETWKDQFAAGQLSPAPPVAATVNQILDAYLADRDGKVESPETLKHSAKPLRREFGSLLPDHLTTPVVRKYITGRQEAGRSNGTIIREIVTLRAALQWAVKEKWIDRAPIIEAPSKPPPRSRWLSREEADKLIAACKGRHIRLFVQLALHTAARRGAILSLEWDRVDLERRVIYLALPGRSHGNKRRAVVPINSTLLSALTAAKAVALTDYVVEYGKRPVASVKTGFQNAVALAGLSGVSPHTLRHTAATWMVQAAVPLAEVARYLGDSERMIERVYGHHAPDYLRRAAAALESPPSG